MQLDNGTRICIRDSLYRLAKSAVNRQHTGNVIGTVVNPQDEHEVLAKEEAVASNRLVNKPTGGCLSYVLLLQRVILSR